MVEQKIRRVVVLTGAGISAESGIATFRATDGLWEDHRIEDVATNDGFLRDPEIVHRFYNARRRTLLGRKDHIASDGKHSAVVFNAAHRALTHFENFLSVVTASDFLLVTQNVDNLHEQAGSINIRHMHGELLKMRCTKSEIAHDWTADCAPQTPCPCCGRLGTLRPDIVWFGEVPFHLDEISEHLKSCDLFVSIGTSGNVYPAAGFFQLARSCGARTVELNLEPSKNGALFDESRYGSATDVVSTFFRELEVQIKAEGR